MTQTEQVDAKTLALVELVRKKKAEIASLDRPNWRTNCSFSWTFRVPNGPIPKDIVNLRTIKDVATLIAIAAFLNEQQKGYDAAAHLFDIESVPKFKWNGFSVKDWLEDIRTLLGTIQLQEKKQKLQQLEARLNAIISPELRRQMEIDAITAELGE